MAKIRNQPQARIHQLRARVRELEQEINTPEIVDFIKAAQREAAHQRQRWGSEHDAGKTVADWYWLLGYLAGKALFNLMAGNREKGLHHIITTAAACANWHLQETRKAEVARRAIKWVAGAKGQRKVKQGAP